jgi:ATP-dependent DNA helicase RecQ
VLEALNAIGDRFKADYLINILCGNMNAIIKSYKHHLIEEFGSGGDKDDKFWSAVIRQGQIHGLIDKNIENYGLLSVSSEGQKYINEPFSIKITEDHNFEEVDDDDSPVPPMSKGGSADDELFGMLKDLRKKVAKKHNLPPFVIFQDPSLEDMSIQYPITFEELQNITGVGAGKARKFGSEFIELIKAYVEEKDIIRPQDMVVKSVVNRSGNKVFIIQSIDRQMDLEDIADARSLTTDELLSEIEVIVNSGTKLNLDYYIKMNIDDDKVDDIYDYFKEDAESDSIEDAVKELGRDYTEEEIRLVRIKFICEQGN